MSSQWVYQNLMLRPLRWVWRQVWWQVWRFVQWFWRWSVRQFWRFITYLRGQIIRGVQWAWARLSTNGRVLTETIIAIVVFITLSVFSNRMVGRVIDQLKSIPLYYLWWGLGISAAIGLLVWIIRTRTGGGWTRGTMRSGWLWWPVTALVVIVIGVGVYRYLSRPESVSSTPATASMTPVSAPLSMSRLPAEIALPIIAQCESGGQQFEADGVTPKHNSIRESSAIGKYQILENSHGERAKSLGYDLRTEAGNEAFAKVLFSEQGLTPWEASRTCWEPQLLAFGGRLPATDTTFIVVAGEKWTETYHFPPAMTVDIRGLSENSRFSMKTQSGNIYNFTPEKSDVVPGAIASASFLALGESTENIRVRLYR